MDTQDSTEWDKIKEIIRYLREAEKLRKDELQELDDVEEEKIDKRLIMGLEFKTLDCLCDCDAEKIARPNIVTKAIENKDRILLNTIYGSLNRK